MPKSVDTIVNEWLSVIHIACDPTPAQLDWMKHFYGEKTGAQAETPS